MKKSKIVLLTALIATLAAFTEVFAANAVIDFAAEKQLIRGFGGINHPVWVGDLTAAQRETAFGNADNQLGFSVLRIWVSDNRNQWSQELTTAKKAIEHGAIVFASPWNPPSSMTETFNRDAKNPQAKRLKHDKYADYATHLNDFVKYMKDNGVDLYAISVQNEPDYAEEWTWWTSAEIIDFLINHARNIDCRIIAPESFQYVKSLSDPILNNAQALANMDILGAHLYGTQYSNFPYPLFKQKGAGKELWMTEVYHPNSEANSGDKWPEALDVAQHIHYAMAEAEFQTYVWWYIRRSYGPMREDGTISKRGYMMAHFSKFIRPGYIRIEATKIPETNVFVSAYKGGNKVVIVAVNKQTSSVNQSFTINNTSIEKAERWVTSQNENLAKGADINIAGGSFTASLPAQSVTTFVGVLPQTTPSSSSVAPSSSSGVSSSSTVSSSSSAAPSSSSTGESSSSSEETVSIAHNPLNIHSEIPKYYTIKGEPVGSIKPTKPGVYLVKEGSSVRKIVVR